MPSSSVFPKIIRILKVLHIFTAPKAATTDFYLYLIHGISPRKGSFTYENHLF